MRGMIVESLSIRNPVNGAEVTTLPASERTVQGREITGILALDEVHEVPSDATGMATGETGGAVALCLAQTEHPDAQVWSSSMLGRRDGLTAATKAQADAGELPFVLFDYRQDASEINPTYSSEWRAQQRKQLLPYLYALYHQNIAGEIAETIFPLADLEAAKERGRDLGLSSPVTAEQMTMLRGKWGSLAVGVGFDRAWGVTERSDFSVLTFLGRPWRGFRSGASPVVLLCSHRFPRHEQGADDILEWMGEYRRLYGPVGAGCLDATQCLDLAVSAKQTLKVGHSTWFPLTETAPTQLKAFSAVAAMARDGRLVLGEGPDTDALIHELTNLRARVNLALTGATFSATRGHDDRAHSLALAGFALGGLRDFGGAVSEARRKERAEEQEHLERYGTLPPTLQTMIRRIHADYNRKTPYPGVGKSNPLI